MHLNFSPRTIKAMDALHANVDKYLDSTGSLELSCELSISTETLAAGIKGVARLSVIRVFSVDHMAKHAYHSPVNLFPFSVELLLLMNSYRLQCFALLYRRIRFT